MVSEGSRTAFRSEELTRSVRSATSLSCPAIMDLTNGGSAPTERAISDDVAMATNASKPEEDVDPIWLSSRTARQIYGLCQVEKVSLRVHPRPRSNA